MLILKNESKMYERERKCQINILIFKMFSMSRSEFRVIPACHLKMAVYSHFM